MRKCIFGNQWHTERLLSVGEGVVAKYIYQQGPIISDKASQLLTSHDHF